MMNDHQERYYKSKLKDRIEELEAEIDKAWGIIHAKSAENARLRNDMQEMADGLRIGIHPDKIADRLEHLAAVQEVPCP